jgi:bacillithiol system protein YtxJ
MGLFSRKKTKHVEEKQIPWNPLTDVKQLDEIVEESKTIPVAIFKHSTRCGISRMVLRNFESSYEIPVNQLKIYYLDLLSYRDISDEIGHKFQVMHQSPQLIVLKNGTAVANASHHSIDASELKNFV